MNGKVSRRDESGGNSRPVVAGPPATPSAATRDGGEPQVRPLTLIITPTRNCNRNCEYCYVRDRHRATNQVMTDEVLEQTLAQAQSRFPELRILWHGGEPSLAGATFFEGVMSLPPGHWLRVSSQECTVQRYWELPAPADRIRARGSDPTEPLNTCRRLFIDAVRVRLRADVPVGTCLSGGVDSSSIVCTIDHMLAAEREITGAVGPRQRTFSAVYDDDGTYDEGRYVDRVLAATAAEGNRVTPTWEQMRDDLPALVWRQDEPFQSTSIFAQWCVMRLARRRGVTVLLDGQGADELLAGYRPYVLHLEDLVRAGRLGDAWREANAIAALTGGSAPMLFARSISRQAQGRVFDGLRSRHHHRAAHPTFLNPQFAARHTALIQPDPHSLDAHLADMVQETSLPHLLRYEDRNSMSFGIEARVPFLDYRFVNFAFTEAAPWRIHRGWTKWILRESLADLVPAEIIWRRDKVGFETPERLWLQAWLVANSAFPEDAWVGDYLNGVVVRERLAAYRKAGGDDRAVWRWINLQLWLKAMAEA